MKTFAAVILSFAFAGSAGAVNRTPGFKTNAGAANAASKGKGVIEARSLGSTQNFRKVITSEQGKGAVIKYLNKNTLAVEATRPIQGKIDRAVALDEGRGGASGGDTVRNSDFNTKSTNATHNAGRRLTESGNIRVGVEGGVKGQTSHNVIVSPSGKVLGADSADGRASKR